MIESILNFIADIKTPVVILHALAGGVGVGSAVVLDFLFFYFLRDLKISKQENAIASLVGKLFLITLGALYVTGLLLFLSDIATYSTSIKFLTKFAVVIVLTINGFFLHYFIAPRMKHIDFTNPQPHKPFVQILAFCSGAVSLSSWVIAYVLGTQKNIPVSLGVALTLYACVIIMGICVSLVTFWYMRQEGLHVMATLVTKRIRKPRLLKK